MLGDHRVLFVVADLQSGGWPGSLRDRLRALQAGTIRSHVADELLRSPGPVVVGGDLNLVASRAPLFSLTRGLDADGSDLVAVDAVRLGERTLATWRNPRDLFTPGRLDFLLVPDATMTAANAFVFATEDLDDATLARLGLERELSGQISDHLVVVADLHFGAEAPSTPPSSAIPPNRD
jgi:endonuclease/exonuclease/phosphatase family metal-dependent hydrolase